jgi:hypothetical protein
MKILLLCAAFAVALWGQSPPVYVATRSTTLTAAAEVITVQQPTAVLKVVQFKGVAVTCSVACDITLERDGTAATATALTPVALHRLMPATTVNAYRSSNVAVGTVLATYSITAGGLLALDLSDKFLFGAGENLTIRTSSITGTVQITIQWSEK